MKAAALHHRFRSGGTEPPEGCKLVGRQTARVAAFRNRSVTPPIEAPMNQTARLTAQALALLVAVGAQTAVADEGPTWKFSGFGTVGAVIADTDEAQFHSSTLQSSGAGRSPDLGVDSRLGLQGNVKFNDTFSAAGQLLTSEREGLTAQAEWLYGEASIAPWLKLRVGRMVLPVFLVSDSRNVGYATHWVRAPIEVYGLYPASAFDGAQAQVQADWGDTHLTVQASAGRSNVDIHASATKVDAKLKNLYSLNLVVERGNWTLRLGDTESRNTELEGLGLPPFDDSFRGVGVGYDNGKLLVQAEYVARRTSNDGLLDMDGYYATVGYRVGAWTPYGTIGRYEPGRSSLLTGTDTRSLAAGVRWDVFRNVALKAQVESTQNNGLNFVNTTPAFDARAAKVNVFTLLVDFVF